MTCAGWYLSTLNKILVSKTALPWRQQRLEGKGHGAGLAADDIHEPLLENAEQTKAWPSGPEGQGTQNSWGKEADSSLSQLDNKRPFGQILMLFLIICPLWEEATSGHKSPPPGWSGICFFVVWPGSAKPGGREAGCLGWEAEWLANCCVSREQTDRLDRPVLRPLVLPAERPPPASWFSHC